MRCDEMIGVEGYKYSLEKQLSESCAEDGTSIAWLAQRRGRGGNERSN